MASISFVYRAKSSGSMYPKMLDMLQNLLDFCDGNFIIFQSLDEVLECFQVLLSDHEVAPLQVVSEVECLALGPSLVVLPLLL